MGEMYSRVPIMPAGYSSETEVVAGTYADTARVSCSINTNMPPNTSVDDTGGGLPPARMYMDGCVPGRCINVAGGSPPRIAFLAGLPDAYPHIHWPDLRYVQAITTGSEDSDGNTSSDSEDGAVETARCDYCFDHPAALSRAWPKRCRVQH